MLDNAKKTNLRLSEIGEKSEGSKNSVHENNSRNISKYEGSFNTQISNTDRTTNDYDQKIIFHNMSQAKFWKSYTRTEF